MTLPAGTQRVARRPELRPALLGGRSLAAARELRVRVDDDGSLVVVRPGGVREVLAAPGTVRRALHVEHEQARPLRVCPGEIADDLLVLLGDDGPVLAVQVLDWAPPTVVLDDVLRRTTGFRALVQALGLPLEPAGPDDLDRLDPTALQRVLVRAQRRVPGPRAPFLVLLPAMVLGIAAGGFSGTVGAVVLELLCLLLGAPVLLAWVRARRESLLAPRVPRPGGPRAAVLPQGTQGQPAGLAAARMEVSPEDVVLVDRGRELWLPGPAAGGATTLALDEVRVRLLDTAGDELVCMPAALWCPDAAGVAALRGQAEAAGLQVVEGPGDSAWTGEPTDLRRARTRPSRLLGPAERGDLRDAPYGLGLLYAMCAVAGGAVATASSLLGLPLLVVALGLLASALETGLRSRLADARALRRPRSAR